MNAALTALPKNSQLEQLIEEHLRTPPTFPSGYGARTVFLPWYSPAEHEAVDQIHDLAGRLGMKAIIMPSHYSLTHDARLMADLVEAVCDDADEAAKLNDALQKLPYSGALERTILFRLRKHLEKKGGVGLAKRVAVAALTAGNEAHSSIGRLLDWVRPFQLDAILVLAYRRPSGNVETISLPLHRMAKDVADLVPEIAGHQDDGSENELNAHQPDEPSFYSRLRSYLTSLLPTKRPTDEDSGIPVRAQVAPPRVARRARQDYKVATWAELLARLAGANWAAAAQVSNQWRVVGDRVSEIARRGRDHGLYLDNREEREIFQGRLRFLVLLRVMYPQAFTAAAHELDGADQLYRVHLTLCGAAATDSMLAHSLLPFWQAHLEDPLFCELFYACFLTMEGHRPLSERFGSRSQLHQMLMWLERSRQDERPASRATKELIRIQQDWLRALSDIDTDDSSTEGRSERKVASIIARANAEVIEKLLAEANAVYEGQPSATEAMQGAQILMSIAELMNLRDDDSPESIFDLVECLTQEAINQSAGAIRVDANLLRARLLVLRGEPVAALEILRVMRRTARDALGRCAAQVEEAYVHERELDYVRAVSLYEGAMSIAEDLGADELVARAASGCLRCDVLAESPKSNSGTETAVDDRRAKQDATIMHMRARIALQIQCARAPELFPLSQRDRPIVFVSYRAETRSVTRAIIDTLHNDPDRALRAWADVKLESHQDFNPTIHRRLHDADAIVIVLSPEYFESSWCVAELHFALAQNETRGVPLCWLWCSSSSASQPDTPGGYDRDIPCQIVAWREIRRSLRKVALDRRGHERAHLEERLRRVFARGRLLYDKPVIFEKNAVDARGRPTDANGQLVGEQVEGALPAATAAEICARLLAMAPYLYARAKLTMNSSGGSVSKRGIQ